MRISKIISGMRNVFLASTAIATLLLPCSCVDGQLPQDGPLPSSGESVSFSPQIVDYASGDLDISWSDSHVRSMALVPGPEETLGHDLCIDVSVSDLTQSDFDTRSSAVTSSGDFHDSFGVFMSSYNGNYVVGTAYDSDMNDLKLEKADNWATGVRYPSSDKNMRFWAYAPHSSGFLAGGYVSAPLQVKDGNGGMSFYVDYMSAVKARTFDPLKTMDLMCAYSGELPGGGKSGGVPMQFRHAFAGVKVKIGNNVSPSEMFYDISFSYVPARGTLTFDKDGNFSWNINTEYRGGNSDICFHEGNSGTVLGGGLYLAKNKTFERGESLLGDDVFFVIPKIGNYKDPSGSSHLQEYSNGNTSGHLRVHYLPSGQQYSTTKTLYLYHNWEAGKLYTYTIQKSYKYPAAFMGDSITQHWRESPPTWDGHPEFFTSNNYLNFGVSGQTTSQMLARFEGEVIDNLPKCVVILGGTNDIAGNGGAVTNDQILKNIADMAAMAESAGIKVILCSILPADKYYWATSVAPANRIVEVNALIKSLADAKGYTYVDYYSSMVDPSTKGLQAAYMKSSNDRAHTNSAGYTVMENIIKPVIEKTIAQ